MKHSIAGTFLAAAVSFGSAAVPAENISSDGNWRIAGVRIANPFDPATWWDGGEGMDHSKPVTIAINFADPDFWMKIPNPKTHSMMHAAFTNPETWGQFTKLATYAKMTDRQVLKKWLKLDTYAVLVDPQTYAYWMQPGAYGHLIRIENYAQLVNTSAYRQLWATAKENFEHEYGAHVSEYYDHLLEKEI